MEKNTYTLEYENSFHALAHAEAVKQIDNLLVNVIDAIGPENWPADIAWETAMQIVLHSVAMAEKEHAAFALQAAQDLGEK